MKIIYVVDETSFFLPNILKELINQKKNLHKLVIIIKKVPKKWIKSYVSFLIILLTLLVVHWFTGVQVFAPALLPLVIALFIRYVYLVRNLKR